IPSGRLMPDLWLQFGEEGKLGDVVEDDESGEDQETDERDLVNALFELLIDVTADDAFNDKEEDHAAVQDGDGQKIEDAQIERDVGHQADEGHPAGHGDGLVNLLADSDGAAQAADGDLAREHALEDLDDEQGTFFIEVP